MQNWCRLWTGHSVSGCISMHSQAKVHLLDIPQRTVSTAACNGHALVFHGRETLSAVSAHTEQTCLKCSDQGSSVHFIETISTLNSLRHEKSCKSIMLVEVQVTGPKQNTQALSLLCPSLYNTSTEQLNTNHK